MKLKAMDILELVVATVLATMIALAFLKFTTPKNETKINENETFVQETIEIEETTDDVF